MAQMWDLESIRSSIARWVSECARNAVDPDGLSIELDPLARFVRDQQPQTVREAERLLELILLSDTDMASDRGGLFKVNGAVRNDIGRRNSRVEVSFAPQASGPMAGKS